MHESELPRLLTIPAAARQLAVSSKTICAAIRRGELTAVRLSENGWPRVSETDVRDWLAGRRISTR